jgi:hypothetical protein
MTTQVLDARAMGAPADQSTFLEGKLRRTAQAYIG